jgi:hypothetical protein
MFQCPPSKTPESSRIPAYWDSANRVGRRSTTPLSVLQHELNGTLGREPRRLPQSREDCKEGFRPCPYVSCPYNLYLDVSKTGSLLLNYPDLEPGEMDDSCVLDIAARGPLTLEEIGGYVGVTRERIRQIQDKALLTLLEPMRRSVG